MGARLLAYYEQARQVGGLNAKVKLAMLTKLSSEKAQHAPDSPENIRLFETALHQIKTGA